MFTPLHFYVDKELLIIEENLLELDFLCVYGAEEGTAALLGSLN